MAKKTKTESLYAEILKKHGAQPGSGASGKEDTAPAEPQSKTMEIYNSVLKNAKERKKNQASVQQSRQRDQDIIRRQLYNERYNALVNKVNQRDYDAKAVEQEAERLRGLHGDFYKDSQGGELLLGLDAISKEARRKQTSSGILPEEAETARGNLSAWKARLEEIDTGLLDQQLDAITRNKQPEEYKNDPEYQRIIAAFEEEETLRNKIAAEEARMNLYDRTDGFRIGLVEPLKSQEGFSTAREDYTKGKQERATDAETQLQQARQELERMTYNKSPSQYQQDPEYQALIARIEDLEVTLEGDALGEYLEWWDSLNDYTREAYLENRLTANRGHDVANTWDDMINSDPNVSEELRNQDTRAARHHWERMTDDEINAYYYIANTEGLGAAKKFLEELQITLDQRNTVNRERIEQERLQENTSTMGAMALGVLTVPENLVAGPAAFLSDVYDKATGKEWNPYNDWHGAQSQVSNIRSAGSEKIWEDIAGDGKSTFWNGVGEVAANAYQAGLSTLDSLAGMVTMGNAYTVSMGMGAASSRMRELYESGATDEEIYIGAIGSGILEALFEKMSLDHFTNSFIQENPEKWIMKMLAQAGVEGSEEVFTEISNQILDAANRGVNSDHSRRVQELMSDPENPMSREEAEKQAVVEDVMDIFWAGFGGALSGGFSSIGGAAMDSARQNRTGMDLMSRNMQGDVIAEAQELRQGNKLAQDLANKQEAGSLGKNEGAFGGIKNSRDATRLGRLLEQNVADMTTRDMEAVRTAVEARLQDSGARVLNPEGTAKAITKHLAGESLGVYDRFLLASNEKVADKVRREIYSAADGTTADNAWVKRIETYGGVAGTSQRETNVEKAGREAMETTVREEFGPYSEMVIGMYRGTQNRADFVAEAKEMYQAGMDGVPLDQAPKTQTLEDWQREMAWDMGQGKSEYAYDNNQGFATIKGEATPVNIVGVESAGDGKLTLRTDEGETVDAKDVTFGSYSQSKLYSVIAAMGVDAKTANEIVTMSNETGLDLNTFSRAMQDAFYAGRQGVPFSDMADDRYAMKLTQEQRKVAWQAGRAAARERAVKKGQRVQQGKHGRAKGGVKLEDSARNIQKLNAQQQAGMNAANVLGAMGLDITVYASTEEQRAKGMENGHIQLSDGSIHIDLNAGDSGEGVMAWALSHEFTHFVEEMSPEKFQSFQEVLFQELGKNNQDVLELIEGKVAVLASQQQYSELSEERLWEIATSEVVAEMMEPMLTDTDAIARISDNLRQQDKGLWEKIKDWLSGLVEKLKNAYKDLTPGSAIAQQTRSIVAQSEEILNAWVEAATDAVVNYNLQDGQKNNTPGGVRYSLRQFEDGKRFVDVNTDPHIFDNMTVAEMNKTVKQILMSRFAGKVVGIDNRAFVNGDSVNEYLHPSKNIDLDTRKAKSAAAGELDNLLDAGARLPNEADGRDGHIHPDAIDFSYYKTVFKVGDEYFEGIINIKNIRRGSLLKDITKIKNITEDIVSSYGTNPKSNFLRDASMASIRPNSQNVNPEDTLFSSRNVQQTKNLVALHNITEDKFLKTLELGGFPMPSIAITKADIPHTNFGDITVVFGRETIDPKANRKNTVYSADAWTPTVPQVEYEADSKATSRVYKRLDELTRKVDEHFRGELGRLVYDIEGAMNQYGGEEGVVEEALDNYGVKAAYLEEQGKHITLVTEQKTFASPISEEQQRRYMKVMEMLGVATPEEIGTLIPKNVRDQHGAELEKIWPGISKSPLKISGLLIEIRDWLRGSNGEKTMTVVDENATRNAIDNAIDKTEFEAWVRNLYQGVEKSSGVYNGKPRFTEAGNIRTFRQTHLPATLDGIVKAMLSQNDEKNKNAFGFNGVNTLRAGMAERFSSIADMHKMEGRLQNLTKAQQNEIHDSLSNRLYDTIEAIDEEGVEKQGGSHPMIRYIRIGEILMEIAESGSYNVADIQRVFQQYGKAISDETAMAAKELLFDISQMPVNIFEAKPERAVGFEEIKNVLVPDTASQKLLQELDSRGIPYQTYQAGNEEQRHQMVQDMEDIRFSQRSAAQLERENEKLRRDKEYLKELVRIQRQGNKDVVPTRASVNNMAESLKKETGARGSTEELARLLDDFYRYIGKGNLDTVTMDELAGKVADWVQEHTPVQRDPYAQEVLDWMKKRHVSLSQTQVDEIKYQYGSLREFQSAIKGSIIIDQKANTSLDQLWQEGASQFADQFDADMNEGDMPGAFADLVERLRSSEDTETAEARYYREEVHQDLMSQVYDTYFSVKPIDSISDRMQEQIDKLKKEKDADRKKYREALAKSKSETQKQKEENRATLKAMQEIRKAAVESYRKQQSGSDQRMKQLYEKQYRMVMDDYQRQLETMEGSEKTQAKVEGWRKTEERGKLQRTLTTLNKMMLNPTKTAFVPDSLQPAVIHAMEAMNNYRLSEEIDMGKIQELRHELDTLLLDGATKNQKRIQAINKQLDKLQGDYGSVQDSLTELKRMYAELMDANEGKVAQVYDEGVEGFIADAMEAIGDTDYSDLSVKQLQALNDAYAAILHRVRTANNTFAFDQKEAIDQLAKTAAGDLRRLPDREKLSGENVGPLEKFAWNNLKPVYAFERLGSATMTTLYNNLRKGEDVFYQDVVGARAWALECMEEFGYGQWKDQLIEYESVDGKKFSLNLEERMSLYAYSRRRQAIEHLTKGGIVLSENTKRTVKGLLGVRTEKVFHDYNNYRLSLETVQEIGKSLTKEQREFAEKMQEYLSTVCADKNNEISRALYGVSKAKEKYYWPLKASSLFSERVRNQQQNPGNRQKNAGHMKATTPHANNPVEVAGFLETWGNHVNNTAMYHAFTLPMEDFLRVYNFNSTAGVTDESIVQLITKKHGKGATDYIDQFLKDLNSGVRADPRETIASSLTSKFKKGAVSASLSVAIQQPSAVGRAFAVIDPKYFSLADLRYYATSTVKQKAAEKQWEKVKKYAPVAGIKEMGRFDVNMGRSTVDFITGAGETGFLAKLDEISGYLPERMDQATWLMLWNAAERQCKAQGYTGEALNKAAGKLFTECITKTQVYDSVFSRSGNMRSKSLYMNMATAFMAEPTTTANMFMSAMADVKGKDYKAAKRKIGSIAAATVLNALLASLVYAARDDDEDKSYTEKYLKSLTSELVDSANPLGYVPIAKDLWSLLQGYDVDRSDMTLWSEAANTLKRLKSAYDSMAELDEEDDDYEVKLKEAQAKAAQAWGNAAGAICNLFGVPVKNVLREIRAVVNTWETVGEGRNADWETTKYAMWEAFQENLPEVIRTEDSKADQLYKALVSGSDVWVERMKASYTDEKAYDNAVLGALRDYDKRIRAAAKEMSQNADSTQYRKYVRDIVAEGHFSEEQVERAIWAEARAIKGEFTDYSTKTIEKFVDLYEDNLLTAEQFTDFWEYKAAEDDSGKKLHNKDDIIVYIGKMKVNATAKDTLYLKIMKYKEEDLETTPWHSSGYTYWEARVEYPEMADYSDTAVSKFLEIRNSQITVKVFTGVYEYRYAVDDEGKQLHTVEEIMAYIHGLAISRENKDELLAAMGYKGKTLQKAPWN